VVHGKLAGATTKSEASYVLKGNVLDELGFPEDAKKTYDQLFSIQPSSYWGYLNLGVCELKRGNVEAAREASKKARDLQPKRVSPYFNLARAAALSGCDYEERDALAKLLEVANDDPRAEVARARIKDLDTIDLAVDDTNPFATIALNEKLAHATWRSKKHRERFPDACGYVLTFEEEKEILSTVVLPDLRKAKDNNPAASEPRYDVLLRVGDAGFLDEYIYDTEKQALGAPAVTWLNAHADRKAAYEDWARKEGFIKDPSAVTAEPDLPAEVLSAIRASKAHYIIDRGRPSDTGRFFEVERQRYRAEPSLQRGDEINCAKADVLLATARNRDVGIPGGTFTEADGIHVHAMKPEWLAYLTAKAAWRNETGLRKKYGGADAYAPSVEEEVFAFRAASQGYGDGRTQSQGTFEQVPMLDRLMEIDRSGHLRGFVLYEVLHRRYGMTIRSVTAKDAADVDAYLQSYVFVPAGQAP
jgi:Flp pilus assembly protein TadD